MQVYFFVGYIHFITSVERQVNCFFSKFHVFFPFFLLINLARTFSTRINILVLFLILGENLSAFHHSVYLAVTMSYPGFVISRLICFISNFLKFFLNHIRILHLSINFPALLNVLIVFKLNIHNMNKGVELVIWISQLEICVPSFARMRKFGFFFYILPLFSYENVGGYFSSLHLWLLLCNAKNLSRTEFFKIT